MTTSTPRIPQIELKTSATMPRVVKLFDLVSRGPRFRRGIAMLRKGTHPSGNSAGGEGWPSKLNRSTVLPAALPLMGILSTAHVSKCSCGMLRVFCSSRGASTKVAINPETTCHSMWQWKSQTPVLPLASASLVQILGAGLTSTTKYRDIRIKRADSLGVQNTYQDYQP